MADENETLLSSEYKFVHACVQGSVFGMKTLFGEHGRAGATMNWHV